MLKKLTMVDVHCPRCGHDFEDLIHVDGELVLCPACRIKCQAYLCGRGVHAHNRHHEGSAKTWRV